MLLLPRFAGNAQDAPRGYWILVTAVSGERCAVVVCPWCARLTGLCGPHSISDDGTVSPRVVCPSTTCRWHGEVRLVGWASPGMPPGGNVGAA